MTTSAAPSTTSAKPSRETGFALLRVVGLGLFLATAAALVVTVGRGGEWKAPRVEATPKSDPTIDESPPAPSAVIQRSVPEAAPVTSTGDVSPSAVANLAAALSGDAPKHDPGGKLPKPQSGSLFYGSRLDPKTTLRVFVVSGTPESALKAFGKDLETAGFHRSDSIEKPDARGRYRRIYGKTDVEALITASHGEKGTLLTVVEGPRKDEP